MSFVEDRIQALLPVLDIPTYQFKSTFSQAINVELTQPVDGDVLHPVKQLPMLLD